MLLPKTAKENRKKERLTDDLKIGSIFFGDKNYYYLIKLLTKIYWSYYEGIITSFFSSAAEQHGFIFFKFKENLIYLIQRNSHYFNNFRKYL